MDIVRSVVIELRPRLRCCTVFLTTAHLVKQDTLKITIRPDCIVVNFSQCMERPSELYTTRSNRALTRHDSTSSCESYTDSEEETTYSKFLDMKPFCKLVPGSLSTLKIESNVVSFRILTEPIGPNSTGNFYNEVYSQNSMNKLNIQNGDNLQVKEMQSVNVKKSVPVRMLCENCSNNLAADTDDVLTFSRVLELPSENMDMSEWFCHDPSGEHRCHDSSKDVSKNQNSLKFEPTKTDLFYGLCFFIMNLDNLSNRFNEFNKKRSIIHCNRCLSWLGSKSGNSTVKLWNSCVKFDSVLTNGESESVPFNLFSYNSEASCLALNDFQYTVKTLMRDSTLGLQIPSSCKILLECTVSNKKQYMLIWVMDRDLEILKLATENDSTDMNIQNNDAIRLKYGSTAKLLYKVEEENCDEANAWSQDVSVQTAEVSKDMFTEGRAHFLRSSEYIPRSSRFTNGFSVSYLSI